MQLVSAQVSGWQWSGWLSSGRNASRSGTQATFALIIVEFRERIAALRLMETAILPLFSHSSLMSRDTVDTRTQGRTLELDL